MTQSDLRLFGSPISSYYNKIKIALIEFDLAFEEIPFMPGAGKWPESGSPIGKIPFLRHGAGQAYESQAIVEYLEDIRPEGVLSLFPESPLERARCRELIQYIELYIDGSARAIYPAAYWGKPLDQALLTSACEGVEKGLLALERRASLASWMCGEQFTHADAAAWVHLTTVRRAMQNVGKTGFLEQRLPALADYLERLAQRPSVQRTEFDRRNEARRIRDQAASSAKS